MSGAYIMLLVPLVQKRRLLLHPHPLSQVLTRYQHCITDLHTHTEHKSTINNYFLLYHSITTIYKLQYLLKCCVIKQVTVFKK